MRTGTPARVLLAFTALALVLTGTALAETAPDDTARTFYLRNDGTDCGANSHPFLDVAPGTKDLGCGYIGGGPFGEVFHSLDVDTSKVYVTETPVSLRLDALRNVDGKITVTPYVKAPGNAGSGVGQVVVDVSAAALTATNEQVALGAKTTTVTATPVASRQAVPFSLDVPDTLDGTDITELYLTVNVRGVHAAHGFTELNGSSLISVPIHPVVEPVPAPAP